MELGLVAMDKHGMECMRTLLHLSSEGGRAKAMGIVGRFLHAHVHHFEANREEWFKVRRQRRR